MLILATILISSFFFLRKTYIASLSAIFFYESGSCFRVLSIDSIPAVPFLNKRAAKPNLFWYQQLDKS